MTDDHRRGPWDLPPATPTTPEQPVARSAPEEALLKGQNPVWAVVSTLLLGGFLWWIMGSWVFAVAGVFGLVVHEYGHVLAMNRLGMGPARIHIIPFLGGLAVAQRPARSEWDGVKVALAGPAFGLIAVIPFVALGFVLNQSIWLAGAWFIAFINLINLAPAPPLDGSKALGPVLARIHPMLERVAMIAVGVLVIGWGVVTGSWLFAAFLALSLYGHLRRGRWRPYGRRLTVKEAGLSLGLFLGTGLLCAATAVGVMMPLAEGSAVEAARMGGGILGFGI